MLRLHNPNERHKVKNKYRVVAFLVSFFMTLMVIGQSTYTCFTKGEILRMYSANVSEEKKILTEGEWTQPPYSVNETEYYFGYPLEYATRSYSTDNFGAARVTFYDYGELPRILIANISSDCFEALRAEFSTDHFVPNSISGAESWDYLQGKLTISFRHYYGNYEKPYSIVMYNSNVVNYEIKNFEENVDWVQEAQKRKEMKIAELIIRADSLKQVSEFEMAIQNLEHALEIEFSKDVQDLISEFKDEHCKYKIRLVDEIYDKADYLNAITAYQEIKGCEVYNEYIRKKISDSNLKITEVKIRDLTKEADQLYKSELYARALIKYKMILDLDSRNTNAINRKKEINDLFAFLAMRKEKTYDYSTSNSSEFKSVQNSIRTFVNSSTLKSSQGKLNFQYNIAFDTLGKNKSNYNVSESTVSETQNFLGGLSSTSPIGPTKDRGYFMNSKSSISFDCNWNTSQVIVRSRRNSIGYSDNQLKLDEIKSFVQSPTPKYGEFTFNVKTKNVNGSVYRDISLVDYETKAGPGNVFLSMLLPGTGTLNVTHGEKGAGRLVWFILFTGSSIIFNSESNYYYDAYNRATNQQAIQENYDKANSLHKTSLVFASLAATIYVYDVLEVFGRGIKNERNAKALKLSRKNPIKVKEEIITLN